MLTIDVHGHLYDERYLQELADILASPRSDLERASARILARTLTIPASWDIDDRVDVMDRLRLDAQVLSVSIPFTYDGDATTRLRMARISNDRLALAAHQYPGRFFALATLPLPDVDASLRELDRCFDDLEMVGVMFGSNVNGMRLDNPVFAPIFDELDRRGTVVFLHPNLPVCSGADVVDMNISSTLAYIFDTGVTVYRMIFSGMLERYSRLKVVVPHLGGMLPYLSGRLEESYRSGRAGNALSKPPGEYLRDLYYDTLINHQPALRLATDQFGADHLMLGSDYPLGSGSLEDAVAFVREADLTESERELVLGANAMRLLNLPVTAPAALSSPIAAATGDY
jgi:aminocarboxymuconate-semialdehyde decarboxylase